MNSRKLWANLLYQRSPYPLFIRIAPRAFMPEPQDMWNGLSVYIPVSMALLVAMLPVFFRNEIFAVLIVTMVCPAGFIMLFSVLATPFVVTGGILYGLRIANQVSGELGYLHRIGTDDLIAVTPPGRLGMVRAVSAGVLRQRGLFIGMGIYSAVALHRMLSISLSMVGALMLNAYTYRTFWGELDVLFFVINGLATLVLMVLTALVMHLDFRQSLMIGVTAGVFSGTVMLDRIDAQGGAFTLLMSITLVTAFIIATTGITGAVLARLMLPEPYHALLIVASTLGGYGVALAAREQLIGGLWTLINVHEDFVLE